LISLLRFGGCELDREARELRRAGRAVPLSPRAFELLGLLLDARPHPVPHDQLRDALWPDAFVGYTSLAQLVTEVRKAIGDADAGARMIRTVPRFGYAFVAPVAEERRSWAEPFAGVLVSSDREFLIPSGETFVGRGEECGIRLPSPGVSRVHARIRVDAGAVWVEDAGSKNGTWIGERKIEGAALLRDGDQLALGRYHLTFHSADATATRTAHPPQHPSRPPRSTGHAD
jgi:DNA-binding winged helix-turn-helix (wHTH) protein